MTEFTFSAGDWETLGTFMALVLFALGFQMFGGGR